MKVGITEEVGLEGFGRASDPEWYQADVYDRTRVVTIDDARKSAKDIALKVMWLGAEQPEKIRALLDIDRASVYRLNMSQIPFMSIRELVALNDSILVCYDGSVASHVANVLKTEYGVSTYVLRGGIRDVAIGYLRMRA